MILYVDLLVHPYSLTKKISKVVLSTSTLSTLLTLMTKRCMAVDNSRLTIPLDLR